VLNSFTLIFKVTGFHRPVYTDCFPHFFAGGDVMKENEHVERVKSTLQMVCKKCNILRQTVAKLQQDITERDALILTLKKGNMASFTLAAPPMPGPVCGELPALSVQTGNRVIFVCKAATDGNSFFEKAIKHVHVLCASTDKENVMAQKTVAKVEAMGKIDREMIKEKDKTIQQLEEEKIKREEEMENMLVEMKALGKVDEEKTKENQVHLSCFRASSVC